MGMAKYDRLLYILNLLRSRRTLNAARLAEECQVTERSIYRDIISLSEANIPIYYDHGYKLASNNFLPPLNFSFDEYTCLKLAIESTPLAKAGRKAELLKQVKAKIESGLSESILEQRKTAVDTAHIDIDTTLKKQSVTRYYADIEVAVSEQESLDLVYETINHGLTERRVDPYFIVFRRHAFYFVAYCHLRGDFRTFRIDRVQKLVRSGRKFHRKRGITAADYFADSWGLYSGTPVDVEVVFSGIAARVVLSGRHHSREKVARLADGRVNYRVTVRGTEEIKRWLLGFGAEAEVKAPVSLGRELARIGRDLSRLYESLPPD
jgi:predicted DNA-binding transcriptional regulator YafY